MNYRNIIIVIMAVALVACGGPEERKAKYRAQAQEYLEAGNYPKARVALRNVLKIDPKDADAYFLFAQVEEKEKNWRNAVVLYQEVVRLVPDHTGALIILAKYYLEARLTEEVVSTADKVLAKDPQHPQAKALKIAVLAVEGKLPDAMTKAEALQVAISNRARRGDLAGHSLRPTAALSRCGSHVAAGAGCSSERHGSPEQSGYDPGSGERYGRCGDGGSPHDRGGTDAVRSPAQAGPVLQRSRRT